MGLIRFMLAISVVIAHTSDLFGFGFVGGEMAVKIFFMISGFYMALILNEKYIGANSSYWLFLKNRLLRLYPLYFLVLFLTLIITYFGYSINPSIQSAYTSFLTYGDQLSSSTMAYLITANGAMFGMDTSLFLGLNPTTGELFFTQNFFLTNPKVHSFLYVPQAWSISIELMFYLIAPLIVRKLKILFIVLVLSFSIALILMLAEFPNDPWNYRFFPSQLMYFAFGSIGYIIFTKIKSSGIRIFENLKWIFFLITLFVTLMYSFILLYIDAFVLSIITIIIYMIAIPLIFDLSKNWKKDRFVGELSYSIYMIHILIIYCIKLTGITNLFIFGLSEMAVFSTVIVSIIVYKLFLEKLEKYRRI